MIMKKLKTLLFVGALIGASPVMAQECLGLGDVACYLITPWPQVSDPVTAVGHTSTAVEQIAIEVKTVIEDELQKQLEFLKTAEDVKTELSKVTLPTEETIGEVASGLIAGDEDASTEQKTTTGALAAAEQDTMTSAAGTLATRSHYQQYRAYEEQEKVVRMVASALVVKNSLDNLREVMDTFDKKQGEFSNNDYNTLLRGYAYNSLIYDHLLSLEQQVIAKRLQVAAVKQMIATETVSNEIQQGAKTNE